MTQSVLTIDQIRIHPGSVSKEEAMREAAGILQDAGAVTAAYFDAMLQREQTVSTYMGNELAIPHGTNETKDAILDSALSFVRYDGGVDWDGKTCHVCIPIASNSDEHIAILSALASVLADKAKAERLQTTTNIDEVLELLAPEED
mgnify:CR=1 FL=1